MPFVDLGYPIEYEWVGSRAQTTQAIVMLHHGLGSVSAWRDFPRTVSDTTGLPVLAYSRRGYGASHPASRPPWSVEFMHREARRDLPRLLDTLDVREPILLGQSDGASIAIIYAASGLSPQPLGLILLAPHVMVETCTVVSAARARIEFETGDLRERLARHHRDPDGAFHGWNATWLLPQFRRWNIEGLVPRIRCPIAVVQGADDEYGSEAQVKSIRDRARVPVDAVLLPECGHSPHRDQEAETLAAVQRLAQSVTSGR